MSLTLETVADFPFVFFIVCATAKRWGRIFTPNKSKVHGDGRIAVVTAVRGIWDDIVPEYQHAVENGAPLTTDTILDKMKEELPRPKQGGDKQWVRRI